MALDFPANPTSGQVYGSYTYNSTVGAWQSREDSRTVAVLSSTVPVSANPGDIWVNTNDGISFVYYDDGTSAQWMELLPSGVPLLNTKANISGDTFTGNITAPRFISNITTGTAPFGVTSTTLVSNLNADLLDGQHSAAFSPVAGSSSIATVGTIASGIWEGTKIDIAHGGTGANNATDALSNLGALPTAGGNMTGNITSSYGGTATRITLGNTTAGTDQYLSGITLSNDTGYKVSHFLNSSTRTIDGGVNGYTIRNDGGPLNLGHPSYTTTIYGRTLNPNQTAFYARGAETSGTLSNGGDIPFGTAELNIGSNYNTSTYRFTAPVSGVYQINTSLFNVGGTGRVSIKVNGASKYNSQNNWDTSWAWAGTIYLNANDYVTVGDWQSLGGASIYYGHSSFSGFLVG